MDEIKETLSILKNRWLEAALIIGLMAVPVPFINLLLTIYPPQASRMIFANRGTMVLHISILLFVLLIAGGFLRTVHLEQKKHQSLYTLILTGKHFFSRLFRFGILYIAVTMFPIMGLYLIAQAVSSGANFNETLHFVIRIGIPIIQLIFVKPVLLVPAIIIVLDCDLFKSFGFMRRTKLLSAKPLLAVFLVQISLWLFSPNLQQGSLWQYAVEILYGIISQGVYLSVQIMAVRFVGSLGIDYYRPYEPSKLTGTI